MKLMLAAVLARDTDLLILDEMLRLTEKGIVPVDEAAQPPQEKRILRTAVLQGNPF